MPGSSDAAAQLESVADTPAESDRKRPRKSKVHSERKADTTSAAIPSDEAKKSSSAAEKKRTKVLAGRPKSKAKEKTRWAKSA